MSKPVKGQRETWRNIPSLPAYIASSHGRLMRLPHRNVGTQGQKPYGGTPTTGAWDQRQRRFCIVYQGKTYRVARLICEAFHGPAPSKDAVCMHLDENSRNNRPDNLKWGTQRENLNAPGFLRYCRQRTGENNPFVKGRLRKAAAA